MSQIMATQPAAPNYAFSAAVRLLSDGMIGWICRHFRKKGHLVDASLLPLTLHNQTTTIPRSIKPSSKKWEDGSTTTTQCDVFSGLILFRALAENNQIL